jgi:hypothetical protein
VDERETEARREGEIAPTYRLRRREVMKVRTTWLIMVLVLCLMTARAIMRGVPIESRGGQVLTFILVVVLPMVALILWRLGLLPPERVRADDPPAK